MIHCTALWPWGFSHLYVGSMDGKEPCKLGKS
jgi:hypothetical protein